MVLKKYEIIVRDSLKQVFIDKILVIKTRIWTPRRCTFCKHFAFPLDEIWKKTLLSEFSCRLKVSLFTTISFTIFSWLIPRKYYISHILTISTNNSKATHTRSASGVRMQTDHDQDRCQ